MPVAHALHVAARSHMPDPPGASESVLHLKCRRTPALNICGEMSQVDAQQVTETRMDTAAAWATWAGPGRDADSRFPPIHGVERPPWVFLSNHGHVLLAIAGQPTARLRDIAGWVGITERAALRIVGDLVAAGHVVSRRVGRRNSYEIHPDAPLRHPRWSDHTVRDLLDLTQRPAR